MNHPLDGKKVVAVLPHGFVHFGVLHDVHGGVRYLSEASNLRRWVTRKEGLPGFANDGPRPNDKVDYAGDIYLEQVIFFYEANF